MRRPGAEWLGELARPRLERLRMTCPLRGVAESGVGDVYELVVTVDGDVRVGSDSVRVVGDRVACYCWT